MGGRFLQKNKTAYAAVTINYLFLRFFGHLARKVICSNNSQQTSGPLAPKAPQGRWIPARPSRCGHWGGVACQ